jgi:iron complex outermembrane receptor protein
VRGFEGEVNLVAGGFELSPHYSFTEARFDNYISPNPTGGGFSDYSGIPLPVTPKNKVGVTAAYSYVFDAGTIRPSIDYSYQSSLIFRATEPNDPFNVNPGYGLVNARVDWSNFLGHPVTVSFFVTNLSDKIYRVYLVGTYSGLGFSSSVYGPPRMWGAELRYDF